MDRSIGYAAALLATIIWAGNFIVARAFADAMPPWQLNFWRWLVALIVILPFGFRSLRRDREAFLKHFRYFVWLALLGVTLMNTLVYEAGNTTSSLNMALIMPATPVIILLLARIFYHETITLQRLAGMLLALTGIFVLISKGKLETLYKFDFTLGDLWTIGAMLCFAIYSLLMRQRPQEVSVAGFNIIVFSLGLALSLPAVFLESIMSPAPGIDSLLMGGILYAGLGCSAIAFWLWTVGIDRIGPVRAGIVYYSLPLFTAIMSTQILDEAVTAIQIFGGVMIIGGIFVATIQRQKVLTK